MLSYVYCTPNVYWPRTPHSPNSLQLQPQLQHQPRPPVPWAQAISGSGRGTTPRQLVRRMRTEEKARKEEERQRRASLVLQRAFWRKRAREHAKKRKYLAALGACGRRHAWRSGVPPAGWCGAPRIRTASALSLIHI